MFQGFRQQAVDFLWGIRFNNERSWFLEHKQEYLTYVAEPLRQLGEEVQQVMEEKYPELGLNSMSPGSIGMPGGSMAVAPIRTVCGLPCAGPRSGGSAARLLF